MVKISGGDKLEKALAEIARKLDKSATLEVGFLPGATYVDGTSVAMVAAINEFGAPSRGQPPRPFFRNMIAKHSGEWPDAVVKILQANGHDPENGLARLGAVIKDELQQSITEFTSPALAPSTIKKKGFNKPLIGGGIESGHMLASVDFVVKTGGE